MTVLNRMAKNMSAPNGYNRTLPPISEAAAEAEPESDRLFADLPPAPSYPHLTISTTVIDPDGFTWSVTFNDTPLAAAAAILAKRGCRPAGAVPSSPSQVSAAPTPSSAPPCCPTHAGRLMKPMHHADKQGHQWMCTAKVGDGWCEERA